MTNNTLMVTDEKLKVEFTDNQEIVISGRLLHEFLEIKTPYKKWFDRMVEYGFVENVDFAVLDKNVQNPQGGRPSTDHAIKIDMAKELSMIQRTERGKQARQYFIEVEKKYNTPELVMARALKMADKTIKDLGSKIGQLEAKVEEDRPKVLFADSVESSDSSILVGELAKILKQNGYDTGQNRLFDWLRESGYLIRQKGENYNLPTQYSMDLGLMEVKKRSISNPDGSVRVTRTTKVTGKGQVYFINKFIGGLNDY